MSSPKPEISSHDNSDTNEDAMDSLFVKRSCCGSFWSFQSLDSDRSSSSAAVAADASAAGSPWWRRFAVCGSSSDNDEDYDYDPWYKKGWNMVRQWSEHLAGPKWKTFIRRFGKNSTRSNGKSGPGQFRYDPLSYSLNFDEGIDDDLDVDTLRRDFSSRYASIPASCKSSMDLGRFHSGQLYT